MASVLLIDDIRSFKSEIEIEGVVVARTLWEGLSVLEGNWDQIWLDHDLGIDLNGNPETIMPLVDRMCISADEGDPVRVDLVVVHTSNPVGGDAMMKRLSRSGYKVIRVNATEYFRG